MEGRLITCTAILLSSVVLYGSVALAQCSLNIQSNIRSGWNKDGVAYTVEKNTLRIKVSAGSREDTDSIYIGSIKGCSTLTIDVSQISGKYPWGGKVIGFSFANDTLESHQWGNHASFPPPSGGAIEDGFIKSALSNNTTLVYAIDDSTRTLHIGAKVFIGANNTLELQFGAQDASNKLQTSAPLVSQPSKRFTARTALQPDSAAMSCAQNCHEPRTARREFVAARGFSIPPLDACPDEHD